MSLNEDMRDGSVDRAAMVRLFENNVQQKVDGAFIEHEKRIAVAVAEGRDPEKEIRRAYSEIKAIHKKSLLELAYSQIEHTSTLMKRKIGRIWGVEPPTRRVAENFVLSQPLSESGTLEQGWRGIELSERRHVEKIIRAGIANGDKPADIAKRVSKLNIPRNQANALVTTSITTVQAQADFAVYEANGKALKGWQYIAILDRRTTPICAHRDGRVYTLEDKRMLPPAHFRCRSTTAPVFLSYDDIGKLEGVANVRKRNLANLSTKERDYYDGAAGFDVPYSTWLSRQPQDVQIRHLGSYEKSELFASGALPVERFEDAGRSVGIAELRAQTASGRVPDGDTRRFAVARQKLDALHLGATSPDDFIGDAELMKRLTDYYMLQAGELNGILSLTNYRGNLLGNKRLTRARVMNNPPRDDQVRFNPITGKYDDARMYQPNPTVHANALRLVAESPDLLPADRAFIEQVDARLASRMHLNERAVILDNLRATFSRYRRNPEPWVNFKAVTQGQLKFDIMNISEAIETQLRRDTGMLRRMNDQNYIDPVLGPTQLKTLHDDLIENIISKNRWEDGMAPKIAKELQRLVAPRIALENPLIWKRLSDSDLKQFFLRFANRLSLADGPDKDQLAVSLGRDLYNAANLNGDRNAWFALGNTVLEAPNVQKFYTIESMGVQKRRMKKKTGSGYFGPYYDTQAFNIMITDPRIREYSQLTRKVDVGMRVPGDHRLHFKEGTKTYWVKRALGWYDTRVPITSTSSFGDFPPEFVDKNLKDALDWASRSQYKIDHDYFDFSMKLLRFEDDRGNAKKYHEMNEYRKYILERGDSYERFKAMEWLRQEDRAFSNAAFIDHRGRVYDRGMISPQSGESFRPFLNTVEEKAFNRMHFMNFQDQIGAFLGGLSDSIEGKFNSLTITGRQGIAQKYRQDLVDIGHAMRRSKPADIRFILEHPLASQIDGEEVGKFYRFALEASKIDDFLETRRSMAYQEALTYIGIKDSDKFLDINRTFILAADKPIEIIKIADIEFPKYTLRDRFKRSEERRVATADLTAPLTLELRGDGKYEWIDGWHRLEAARRKGVKELPARVLSTKEVNTAIVDKKDLTEYDKDGLTDVGYPLREKYSKANLDMLDGYKTGLALEQDASSSGAQIIALTTKNKQLAELSNVVATDQKRRLYDEIAAATFNDPRFKVLNEKLGLTEKDLRKAAKAQNMVNIAMYKLREFGESLMLS